MSDIDTNLNSTEESLATKNVRLKCEENWVKKNFSYPKRKIRLATCFSGIGAIEHAFQRLNLNHEIIFAGDIDRKCKESYFANYTISEENWHSDITNFGATKYLNKVDLLVGGAPCQAFSMVGKRKGFDDITSSNACRNRVS